ncbi:hypothetical protein MYX76_01530 [Desulfobacterota bacterium AH_259_B03_O07]|nr:hypothetical protein [Desulfobacterota bacterium AH_259_B03_O07]
MSTFNKLLLIICFGIFALGLGACPQQQPSGEVEEEVVEEVEVPVATPADATPAP